LAIEIESGAILGLKIILCELDAEIAQLNKARALLIGGIAIVTKRRRGPGRPSAVVEVEKSSTRKSNISPEGRKRIAEAVKRRWAAQKRLRQGSSWPDITGFRVAGQLESTDERASPVGEAQSGCNTGLLVPTAALYPIQRPALESASMFVEAAHSSRLLTPPAGISPAPTA
jgi:hypothetical protein